MTSRYDPDIGERKQKEEKPQKNLLSFGHTVAFGSKKGNFKLNFIKTAYILSTILKTAHNNFLRVKKLYLHRKMPNNGSFLLALFCSGYLFAIFIKKRSFLNN